MPVAKQQKVIGVVRTTLLRADLIEVTQLMRRASGLRSVDSLLKSAGITMQELRTKSYAELQRIAARRLAERRRQEGQRVRRRKTKRRTATRPGELGGGYYAA